MKKEDIIKYEEIPVMTTDQVAKAFNVTPQNIRSNWNNNKEYFIEGKHYYLLKGENASIFCQKKFSSSEITDALLNKVIKNGIYLWTKRGVARLSKSIGNKVAWSIFEKLEESYFKETERKNDHNQNDFYGKLIEKLDNINTTQLVTVEKVENLTINVNNIENKVEVLKANQDYTSNRLDVYSERKYLNDGNDYVSLQELHESGYTSLSHKKLEEASKKWGYEIKSKTLPLESKYCDYRAYHADVLMLEFKIDYYLMQKKRGY